MEVQQRAVAGLAASFLAAGVRPGGILLVHTSLASLGPVPGGADTVLDAFLRALGPTGTLVIPTLSYLFCTKEHPVFDVRSTPTNLGAIPSAALRRAGALRSLHPTHSCAALGARAAEVVARHGEDTTPVGPHSPFSVVRALGGQVGFLGCGCRTNTSIHGVEELLSPPPPYLLLPQPVACRVTDAEGVTREVAHRRHNFEGVGQRYERLPGMVPAGAFTSGPVGEKGALLELFDAPAMWATALEALRKDPWALCAGVAPGAEGHHLKTGGGGAYYSYSVGAPPAPLAAAAPPRVNIPGGSPYEPTVGYSRAVRVGAALHLSGTTASSEGAPLASGPDAALLQAREALAIIRRVLGANGARVEDVVRTRMFVVDIAKNGAAVGAAHGEVFSRARPAASMLGVAALIDPAMLVEIEVDAVVGCGAALS